jgi:hypothetical protein
MVSRETIQVRRKVFALSLHELASSDFHRVEIHMEPSGLRPPNVPGVVELWPANAPTYDRQA